MYLPLLVNSKTRPPLQEEVAQNKTLHYTPMVQDLPLNPLLNIQLHNFLKTIFTTDLHSTQMKGQVQEDHHSIKHKPPQAVQNQGIQAARALIQLQPARSVLFKGVPRIIHRKILPLIPRRQLPCIIRHKSLKPQRREWARRLRIKF